MCCMRTVHECNTHFVLSGFHFSLSFLHCYGRHHLIITETESYLRNRGELAYVENRCYAPAVNSTEEPLYRICIDKIVYKQP